MKKKLTTLFTLLCICLVSSAQNPFSIYYNHSVANYDDSYYVWRYATTASDTSIDYIGLKLDSIGGYTDPADPSFSVVDYQMLGLPNGYPSNMQMVLDTLSFTFSHEKNSIQPDFITIRIVQLNASGLPGANVLWQNTDTLFTALSPSGNWLGVNSLVDYKVNPGLTIPPGVRVAVEFDYTDNSGLDTLGFVAGFVANGTQAFASNYKTSLMRYPPYITNIAPNSTIGYGTPAGSLGWFEAQNWLISAHISCSFTGGPPVAAFGANVLSITAGQTVNFSDLSSNNPNAWNWTFSGGIPGNSNLQNPTGIFYGNPGCYAVSLTASNGSGSNTASQTCYILVNPASTGTPACQTDLGESFNPFTVYSRSQRPILDYHPDLNLLTFIHRESINSGNALVTDISRDGGSTWQVNQGPIYYPSSFVARYPMGVVYNPTGNTNADSAYLSYQAAGLNAGAWTGIVSGASRIGNISAPAQIEESYASLNRTSSVGSNLESDGNGVTWTLLSTEISDTGSTRYSDTLVIRKGVFNTTLKRHVYSETFLPFPVIRAGLDPIFSYQSLNVAFSEDGQTGYLVVGACADLSFSPDSVPYWNIWKTTNGGASWSAQPFKILPDINVMLGDTGNVYAETSFLSGSDAVVDKNGKLHIISSACISDGPLAMFQTGAIISIITDGQSTHQKEFLASPSIFFGDYEYGSGTSFNEGTRAQIAMNAARDKIYYCWFETPAPALYGNVNPDMFMKSYDVDATQWSSSSNLSENATFAGNMHMGSVAKFTGTCGSGDQILVTVAEQILNSSNPVNYKFCNFCCYAPPVAAFIASNLNITAGQAINFFDLSSNNPTGWQWTFNGAVQGSSSAQNPGGIVYNNPGCYAVTLSVSNPSGSDTHTEVCYIQVNPASSGPVISPAGPVNLCQGDTVILTSSPGFSYLWNTGATTQSIVVTQSGTYFVSVTDSSGTQSSAPVSVNVTNLPFPTFFISNNTLFGPPFPAQFTNTTPGAAGYFFQWNFGDGGSSNSNASLVNYSYSAPGTYSVSLTISDTSGCSLSNSQPGNPAQTVYCSLASACNPPAPINILNSGSSSFAFDWNDVPAAVAGYRVRYKLISEPISVSTWSNPLFTSVSQINLSGLMPAADYEIQVSSDCDSSGQSAFSSSLFFLTNCSNTDCPTGAIQENEACGSNVNGGCTMPIPAFQSISCGDKVCGTSWSDNNSSDMDWFEFTLSQASAVTWKVDADFAAVIAVFDANLGCLINPPLDTASSLVNCGAANINLNLNPGTYWAYVSPNTVNGNPCFEGRNRYVAELICTPLVVPPVAAFMASTTAVQPGQSIDFLDQSSNAPTVWSWSFPGGNPATSNVQNPGGIVYNTPGCYPVSLTVSNSAGTDSITSLCYIAVALPGAPVISANGPLTFCQGGSVTLTSSATSGNIWSTGDTTQSIVVDSSGFYTVSIPDTSGLLSSAPVLVNVISSVIFSGSLQISSDTVCAGSPVIFSINNLNGAGNSPGFEWYLNGTFIQSGGLSLTLNNPVNNDRVVCLMNSSATCATPVNLVSDTLSVGVITAPTPQYTISNNSLNALPLTATFQNNTTNATQYDFIWNFGDGSIAQNNAAVLNHTYLNNGIYITGLTAQHQIYGCTSSNYNPADASHTVTCNAPGASGCGFTVITLPSGIVNGCQGGMINLAVGAVPSGSSLQWNRNGVPLGGEILPNLMVTLSGFYSISVTDSNGCTVVSSPVQINFNQSPVQPPVISVQNNNGACGTVNATLTATGGFASFLWSNGASGSSITVNTPGNYFVTGQGSLGCDAVSATVNVSSSIVTSPEICMVTVDPASNHHIIVWEKPITTSIDSFYIYKETPYSSGSYQRIGALDYNELSEFEDAGSNAEILPDRYRISVLDDCGGESAPSAFVRSMHLQVGTGVGVSRVLSWTPYQGQQQNIAYYLIYSGSNANNLNLIDSVAAPTGYYVDNNPVAGPGTSYRVESRLSASCESTRTIRDRTISNIDVNTLNPSSIVDQRDVPLALLLMPNPNKGQFEVMVNTPSGDRIIWSLMDMTGRVIAQETVWQNRWMIHQELASGVYLFQIRIAEGTVLKKVIVE